MKQKHQHFSKSQNFGIKKFEIFEHFEISKILDVDFFRDQLDCHLAPDKIDADPEPYPRHFGITFYKESDFNSLVAQLKDQDVIMLNPVFTRFEDMPEKHLTFFLKDPSNNILEFKFYPNSEMMY